MIIFLYLSVFVVTAFTAACGNLLFLKKFSKRQLQRFLALAAAMAALSGLTAYYILTATPAIPSDQIMWYIGVMMSSLIISGFASGLIVSEFINRRYYADEVEILELENKLLHIKEQTQKVNENLKNERLSETGRATLLDAKKFLADQNSVIFFRIKVLRYLVWEAQTYKQFQKYFKMDYLKGSPNFDKIRANIEALIKSAQQMRDNWYFNSYRSDPFKNQTCNDIRSRANAFVNHLSDLLNDLANYEALHTSLGVKQLESNDLQSLRLAETNIGDAVEQLSRSQTVRLDRELIFQNLRIKSLNDIQS